MKDYRNVALHQAFQSIKVNMKYYQQVDSLATHATITVFKAH